MSLHHFCRSPQLGYGERSPPRIANRPIHGSPVAIWRSLPRTLVAALLAAVTLSGCTVESADERLARSRAIATEFQQALLLELQAAMAEGGPVRAVAVCRDEAPAIAARASAASGADVSRTALRVRNQNNAPDPRATGVLQRFRVEVAAGADLPIESFETRPDGSARYMRAIVLQPPCAACHGTELTPPVKRVIAEHYPDDRATGFEVGDLRGAFLIDWPAEEQAP
jgi:hypothetical protein